MIANKDINIDHLVKRFLDRFQEHDNLSQFPHINLNDIVAEKLHTINLSEHYGGRNFGLEETCNLLIDIASGCSSTGLVLAMHYYSLGGLNNILTESQKTEVFKDIQVNGEFIASISDPNILFARTKDDVKQVTDIKIDKTEGGYIVNGIKKSVSGSPRIKYLPIYGFQEGVRSRYGITALLTTVNEKGISIDNSWSYSGMKSTMSNNIYFKDVFIPESRIIGREGFGIEDTQELIYWFRLALTAVYQGIALCAYNYIRGLAKVKKEKLSNHQLAFFPGVQRNIADMKIKLETSYSQIMRCAQLVDQSIINGAFTDELYKLTLITKQYVSEAANQVVWLAMQVEGMQSLNQGKLLEKLFRDVRAATFHPPNEDLLKEVLAKKELGIISVKKRWL
jgi:alkylation response protein AidB-like acyl-CoA dehydrogenase